MRISSDYLKIIPGLASADYPSGGDSESINMGLLHRVIALCQHGNVSVADAVIKAYAGATAGTKTTALAVKYRFSNAAAKSADADNFTAPVTCVAATGVPIANATDDDKLLLIEVESSDMPDGKPWLTLEVGTGATVHQLSIVFIGEPRFAGRATPTVI